MDQQTLAQLQAQLHAEHDRILAELKSIATPSTDAPGQWDAIYPKFETQETGSEADRDDEEDEVEEYEERVGAKSSLASQLLAITHALERINNKTYGTCKTCRNPIPLERLQANPAAEYDIEHEPK
ncbi:MAG: TraR/DksA C4-type zinc finger protein [Candidatus Sungbacteria bacterium]|nr:TraR/DksA C4-type zinc finger protein [Candidatus Sungbacteria bacterium]